MLDGWFRTGTDLSSVEVGGCGKVVEASKPGTIA